MGKRAPIGTCLLCGSATDAHECDCPIAERLRQLSSPEWVQVARGLWRRDLPRLAR